jgi:hypothetical protein
MFISSKKMYKLQGLGKYSKKKYLQYMIKQPNLWNLTVTF